MSRLSRRHCAILTRPFFITCSSVAPNICSFTSRSTWPLLLPKATILASSVCVSKGNGSSRIGVSSVTLRASKKRTCPSGRTSILMALMSPEPISLMITNCGHQPAKTSLNWNCPWKSFISVPSAAGSKASRGSSHSATVTSSTWKVSFTSSRLRISARKTPTFTTVGEAGGFGIPASMARAPPRGATRKINPATQTGGWAKPRKIRSRRGIIPNLERKWTIGEGSEGRDTRLACPWERERTSEPLVPTSDSNV